MYIQKVLSLALFLRTEKDTVTFINIIQTWKNRSDTGKIASALLMDLSKAFGCIEHNLCIA